MNRLRALAVGAALVGALAVATPALAGDDWCEHDPAYRLGGHTYLVDFRVHRADLGRLHEIKVSLGPDGGLVFSQPAGLEYSVVSVTPVN